MITSHRRYFSDLFYLSSLTRRRFLFVFVLDLWSRRWRREVDQSTSHRSTFSARILMGLSVPPSKSSTTPACSPGTNGIVWWRCLCRAPLGSSRAGHGVEILWIFSIKVRKFSWIFFLLRILIVWLIGWIFIRTTIWLIVRLIDCSIDWLIDWLHVVNCRFFYVVLNLFSGW